MSGAKDPDEYIKKFGPERFRSLIEQSAGKFEFMTDGVKARHDLSDPAERLKALDEVSSYIGGIFSSVERDIYIERAAKEVSVDPKSLRADVEAKRKKAAREAGKKRAGELIRVTAGTGDRVNPDFAKAPKAARIEEGLLGMLLLHPDYLSRAPGGTPLTEDDFVTSLGKRLFAFVRDDASGGSFPFGLLNGAFTPDEVARAARMQAERAELSVNDGKSFDSYAAALREEASKRTEEADSLEAVLARRRSGGD